MTDKPRITSTAALSFQRGVALAELKEFVHSVPESADISVTTQRGDPNDPREAAFQSTTITATWSRP